MRLFADLEHILAPRSFWRVVSQMFANDGMVFAVQLAYFLLLFLFPFFMFLVNVAGLVVPDPVATIARLAANAKGYFPPTMIKLLTGYISDALQKTTASLFAFSALFTFAAGFSAVQTIIRASNSAYGVRETRPFWERLLISVMLVLSFTLFAAAVSFIVLSPQAWSFLEHTIGLSGVLVDLWGILRWMVIFIALTFAFAFLYHVAPNTNVPFRWVTAGGLMTTVFVIIATEIFRLWATVLFRPNQLYGHLGGGIVLLLWLFGIGLVVRFGIEVNVEAARAEEERKDAEGPGPSDT